MPEQNLPSSSPIKKVLLAGAILVATGAYAAWQWTTGRAPATPEASPTGSVSNTPSTPVESTNPKAPKPLAYKDGTFTGAAVDAVYGIVQVAAVVQGGKIVEIEILQQPGGQPTTDKITRESMPQLVQEVLTTQSARVDTISGATQTVDGFVASLTTALLKAQS